MSYTLFDIISFRGFWRKQFLEEDSIGIKLVFGLFGMMISFWGLTIAILIDFTREFFISSYGPESIPDYLKVLDSLGLQLLLGLPISFLCLLLTINLGESFQGFDVRQEFNHFRVELKNSIEELEIDGGDWKIPLIFVILIGNGFVAGLLYTIIYFVPLFVLFILIIFIMFNFLTLGVPLFLISAVFSWILSSIYVVRRKLDLKEKEEKEKPIIQRFTKRDVELLSSEKEPIICDNCRSFIPAESETCPVCHEDISN